MRPTYRLYIDESGDHTYGIREKMPFIIKYGEANKVDYWRNRSQKQRLVATSLLWAEQRLNKVNGYRHLSEIRSALIKEATKGKEAAAA